MTRLWCGRCGKACGRLEGMDPVHYIGRSAWPRTDRHPANKRPINLALSEVEVPSLSVACSSGHWLDLPIASAVRAVRSGEDSLTLTWSRDMS